MDGVFFKHLTHENALLVDRKFTEDEMREAVFGLSNDRALGPDGFFIDIFQQFWNLIKGDLFNFSRNFMKMSDGEISATFIALIPKKEGQ